MDINPNKVDAVNAARELKLFIFDLLNETLKSFGDNKIITVNEKETSQFKKHLENCEFYEKINQRLKEINSKAKIGASGFYYGNLSHIDSVLVCNQMHIIKTYPSYSIKNQKLVFDNCPKPTFQKVTFEEINKKHQEYKELRKQILDLKYDLEDFVTLEQIH